MSKGLVLVTGVTGFVGTDVALAFFKAGYRVRGTARSQEKAASWISHFPEYKDQFESAVVTDISAPGAFDEAIKGVDYVAHTASPFHFDIQDNEKDMLIPALQGTTNILSAIEKEPKVKHLVITSSFAAILDLEAISAGKTVNHTYSDDDWNPATYDTAKVATNPGYVYCASKKVAEKAAWDYIEAKKPSWALTTLCPPMIYGPPNQPVSDLKQLNTSTLDVWRLISGELESVPDTPFPVYVDIRDVALAHVRAVEAPAARNQRYLLIAGHFSNDQMALVIRTERPELVSRVPETQGLPPPAYFKSNSSKVQKDLGIQFTPFKDMVLDTADKLLAIEKSLQK